MHRRQYLLGASALLSLVSGCGGGGEEEVDEGTPTRSERDETTGDDRTPTEGEQTESPTNEDTEPRDETESPTEQRTTAESAGQPDVQFGDGTLVTDDSGVTTQVYAEITVENTGEAPSGVVSVTVEWFDEDGNYLTESIGELPSLAAGEVWIAQIVALTDDPENVADFGVTGEFERQPPRPPDGMAVAESELAVSEFSTEVSGVASNDRDREIGYVEAQAKIFDEQGRVIGGGWTNETDVPANTDWAFEILLSGRAAERASDAADHEAFLDSTAF